MERFIQAPRGCIAAAYLSILAVVASAAGCTGTPEDESTATAPKGVIEVGQAPVDMHPVVVQAIAARVPPTRPDDWEPVIYKVEDESR